MLTEDEIKARKISPTPPSCLISPQQLLKDEFFSNIEAEKSKRGDTEANTGDSKEDGTATAGSVSKPETKSKLQLKKKKVDDDPFASDDEEDGGLKAKSSKPPSKAALNSTSKAAGKPPSKAGASAKKPSSKARATTKRIREESESGEEDAKPKRRAPSKSKE